MKPETQIEIDDVDTDDADNIATQFGKAGNDQIGAVGVFTDPKSLKAYNEYVRDWRWRMSTFRAIEREQMGRPSRAFPGERSY
jgi:hypothetical protein